MLSELLGTKAVSLSSSNYYSPRMGISCEFFPDCFQSKYFLSDFCALILDNSLIISLILINWEEFCILQ